MPGISRQFFEAKPGQNVRSGGRNYRISHILSLDSVMAVDLGTGDSTRLRIETLTRYSESGDEDDELAEKDLYQYSKEEWAEAQRRLQILKPLLADPLRTRSVVKQKASENGVHVATLYKWMKTYQLTGHVSSLVPEKRGRKTGTRLLTKEVEEVISSAIDELYLSKDRGTAQDVVDEVTRRCRRLKIRAPNHNSIRLRIADLPPSQMLKKRARHDEARDRFDPILGAFPGADYAYGLVQIDHTPANVIVVDEVTREPIGRPFLTLAIDVRTRMVVGLYLSLDPPSAASVGLCLSQAICPKREYLAILGVAGEWPVWGVMGKVHCDNAKEFRGYMLDRACEDYNIDLQYRPKKTPHYGGHIERLMGVAANIFRKVPGKTFSNPEKRKGYDSERESAFTLKELEAYFVDHIINIYHGSRHSELKTTPLRAWENGILGDGDSPGIGIPPLPEDPLRIQLDFMPFVGRTCQRYGFVVDNINYYDPLLDPYINAVSADDKSKKQSFTLRRDPRDISVLYFLDPADNRYSPIPYRNMGHPAVSLWELRAAEKKLREEGSEAVDEDKIFETIERMRQRVDDAVKATKAARRSIARRPPGSRPKPKTPPPREVPIPGDAHEKSVHAPSRPAAAEIEDDPFAEPIEPFDVALTR